jgi:galactokinase
MLSSELSRQLARNGLSADEALRKQVLHDLVLEAFARAAGGEPQHTLWVPGRIELFGKHTDYGGGHTLTAPVPRGFVLVARPRRDDVVALHDASRREDLVIATASTPAPDEALKGWRRYAVTVVRRLAKNFPGAGLGADITFASDLPPASGMSSSSALMVALAATLVRLGRLETRDEWQANVASACDAAGYYACLENGMAFGTLAGDAGVGTHGGSEDHVAIVCGKPGHLSAWTFVPPEHVADVALPEDWRLVIASSGVAARKTGAARDAYNDLAVGVRTLLDLWNGHEPPAKSLRAGLTSSPDAADRLRELLPAEATARVRLAARLTQFVNEDARVTEAVRALRSGDGSTLADLAQGSQEDATQLLRNQTPETSALVELARGLGAHAASSFGAGFGGSVWALVAQEEASSFPARWLSEYRSRVGGHDAAMTFEAQPGPPLTWVL